MNDNISGAVNTPKHLKGKIVAGGNYGIPITHEWDGTILTVTSAAGTSSADLKGERGEDGTSVTIIGSFDSEDALKAAHPTGEAGDSYIVAGNLYVWSREGLWDNVGYIQGPQGVQGEPGPLVESDKELSVEGGYADGMVVGIRLLSLAQHIDNSLSSLTQNMDSEFFAMDKRFDNSLSSLTQNMDSEFSGIRQNLVSINEELGKKAVTDSFTAILPLSEWGDNAPFIQSVVVDGILATDEPFIDINLEDATNETSIIESWMSVGRVCASDANTITAYCYEEKPTVDIPIILKVVR